MANAIRVTVGLRCSHLRVAPVILLTICCAVAHVRLSRRATFLKRLHFGLLGLMVFCACRGEEVDEEAKHVHAVNEGHDPFKYSSSVEEVFLGADGEGDGKTNLGDDEE